MSKEAEAKVRSTVLTECTIHTNQRKPIRMEQLGGRFTKRVGVGRVDALVLTLWQCTGGDVASGMSEVELTIELHKRYPDWFSIPGYIEYPDRKIVSCAIHSHGSIIKKGYATSRKGRYYLTSLGIQRAAELDLEQVPDVI